ncbi:hypothetical protein B0H21DRAFT_820459 [Amylocystis lapponica]|nr:hypothetical protein B0H21DRAFT_820459 [Amylocystis lapponica]
MSVFIAQVFACCIRGRSRSSGDPTERTPFIPPTNELPPSRNYVVDYQKLKERLGGIVRSKEGKMVNVNASLPFNLHNSNADQSQSTQTTPPRPTPSISQPRRTPESPSRANMPNILTNRLPSYSPSRDPSPSIQTSRSTSSLHPGDASYLPPEEDPENGVRRPILNARLVRGTGGYGIGGRAAVRKRQGRSATRGRLGRFGELVGVEKRNGNGVAQEVFLPKANGDAEGAVAPGDSDVAANAHIAFSLQPPDAEDSPSHSQDEEYTSVLDETTPQASDFEIQDVGKITQSWGD